MKSLGQIGLLVVLTLTYGCHRKPVGIDEHQPGDVSLVAFGDWGQFTSGRQKVADSMAAYVSGQHSVDAALMLGDNFYVALKSTEDPQIQTLFEKTYDPRLLTFPFYAAMGNHDYTSNNFAIESDYPKRHPETRWHFPARWYRLEFPPEASRPLVTVLMLDSDKDSMPASDWKSQIDWIRDELSKPHGKWTVCCAHHPLFSNGAHGDNGVLQKEWGTIFTEQHLDFYLCGHDHDLQHLEINAWPTSFIVSGGGGAKTRGMRRDNRGPFSHSENGFTYLHFTPTLATVRIISSQEKLLHAFTRDTNGKTQVLSTTPSDKVTKHPLRVIQGLDAAPKPTPRIGPTMPLAPSTLPASLPSESETATHGLTDPRPIDVPPTNPLSPPTTRFSPAGAD